LLSDEAVSLQVVLVEPRSAAGQPLLSQIEALRARFGTRVQFRTIEADASPAVLRSCAAEADLVVLGLSLGWGMDVDRGGAEAMRLFVEFPASLLVLRASA